MPASSTHTLQLGCVMGAWAMQMGLPDRAFYPGVSTCKDGFLSGVTGPRDKGTLKVLPTVSG